MAILTVFDFFKDMSRQNLRANIHFRIPAARVLQSAVGWCILYSLFLRVDKLADGRRTADFRSCIAEIDFGIGDADGAGLVDVGGGEDVLRLVGEDEFTLLGPDHAAGREGTGRQQSAVTRLADTDRFLDSCRDREVLTPRIDGDAPFAIAWRTRVSEEVADLSGRPAVRAVVGGNQQFAGARDDDVSGLIIAGERSGILREKDATALQQRGVADEREDGARREVEFPGDRHRLTRYEIGAIDCPEGVDAQYAVLHLAAGGEQLIEGNGGAGQIKCAAILDGERCVGGQGGGSRFNDAHREEGKRRTRRQRIHPDALRVPGTVTRAGNVA